MSRRPRKPDPAPEPSSAQVRADVDAARARVRRGLAERLPRELVQAMYRTRAEAIVEAQLVGKLRGGIVLYPPTEAEYDAVRIVLVRYGVCELGDFAPAAPEHKTEIALAK